MIRGDACPIAIFYTYFILVSYFFLIFESLPPSLPPTQQTYSHYDVFIFLIRLALHTRYQSFFFNFKVANGGVHDVVGTGFMFYYYYYYYYYYFMFNVNSEACQLVKGLSWFPCPLYNKSITLIISSSFFIANM